MCDQLCPACDPLSRVYRNPAYHSGTQGVVWNDPPIHVFCQADVLDGAILGVLAVVREPHTREGKCVCGEWRVKALLPHCVKERAERETWIALIRASNYARAYREDVDVLAGEGWLDRPRRDYPGQIID